MDWYGFKTDNVKPSRAAPCKCGSPSRYAGGNRVCMKTDTILCAPETNYTALLENAGVRKQSFERIEYKRR